MDLSKNIFKISGSNLLFYNNFLNLINFNSYFLIKSTFKVINKQYIIKKYFNIFLKFNFFIFKNETFYNFNLYLVKRYKSANNHSVVLLY
jgi:hypothetical protein